MCATLLCAPAAASPLPASPCARQSAPVASWWMSCAYQLEGDRSMSPPAVSWWHRGPPHLKFVIASFITLVNVGAGGPPPPLSVGVAAASGPVVAGCDLSLLQPKNP